MEGSKEPTLKLNISAATVRPLSIHVRNQTIREHRHQIPGARQHERERILHGRQIPERLVRVAQKMHHRRRQEHAAGELSSQHQKRLVPLQEVRRHAGDERPDEHQNQAVDLH